MFNTIEKITVSSKPAESEGKVQPKIKSDKAAATKDIKPEEKKTSGTDEPKQRELVSKSDYQLQQAFNALKVQQLFIGNASSPATSK